MLDSTRGQVSKCVARLPSFASKSSTFSEGLSVIITLSAQLQQKTAVLSDDTQNAEHFDLHVLGTQY